MGSGRNLVRSVGISAKEAGLAAELLFGIASAGVSAYVAWKFGLAWFVAAVLGALGLVLGFAAFRLQQQLDNVSEQRGTAQLQFSITYGGWTRHDRLLGITNLGDARTFKVDGRLLSENQWTKVPWRRERENSVWDMRFLMGEQNNLSLNHNPVSGQIDADKEQTAIFRFLSDLPPAECVVHFRFGPFKSEQYRLDGEDWPKKDAGWYDELRRLFRFVAAQELALLAVPNSPTHTDLVPIINIVQSEVAKFEIVGPSFVRPWQEVLGARLRPPKPGQRRMLQPKDLPQDELLADYQNVLKLWLLEIHQEADDIDLYNA